MKTCFKCGQSKPITEFYTHPRMGDGHLGKCKDCTKKDTAKRVARLWNDPEWKQKERSRCREKQNRYRKDGRCKPVNHEAVINWRKRNPEKAYAHNAAEYAMKKGIIKRATICERCGKADRLLHKHHPDYSKPIQILWLCTACHGLQHRKAATE